jgi:DNA-binding IclR family transcriptional regulator
MSQPQVDSNPPRTPMDSETRSDPTLSTLNRGLQILELLASGDAKAGMTLTELGRAFGMHRSTLFRFLATLRGRGYIERDSVTYRYLIGPRGLILAGAYLDRLEIRHVGRPALQTLCERTGEMVHLVILDQADAITIERIEGKHPSSLQTAFGARRPAYCTASGKAILAHLTAEEIDRALPSVMPAFTARTITSAARLFEELSEVRRRGFAIDDEERIEGLRCVAAPIFGSDGRVLGALSLAAPTPRVSRERFRKLCDDVKATADGISRQLGFMGANLSVSWSREPRLKGSVHSS